jgi:hypothetical protein
MYQKAQIQNREETGVVGGLQEAPASQFLPNPLSSLPAPAMEIHRPPDLISARPLPALVFGIIVLSSSSASLSSPHKTTASPRTTQKQFRFPNHLPLLVLVFGIIVFFSPSSSASLSSPHKTTASPRTTQKQFRFPNHLPLLVLVFGIIGHRAPFAVEPTSLGRQTVLC